jgi:hypothetical protein
MTADRDPILRYAAPSNSTRWRLRPARSSTTWTATSGRRDLQQPSLAKLGNRFGIPMTGLARALWALDRAAVVTVKIRLEAERAELARIVDATFRCPDDATAAVLRTFIDRLADDLERRR